MKRSQLEHIIRAAGSIAQDDEVIVLGSGSVLGQFPAFPEDLISSVEADVFPKNKPDLADLVDGSIGELSPFHKAYGYYAHGVGKETANNLPKNWEKRLIRIQNQNTGGITGWCVEVHDLVVGKYVVAREKDLELASVLISRGMIDWKTLLERIEELAPDVRERVRNRAASDFKRCAGPRGSALD
jgi:hypothetical protein